MASVTTRKPHQYWCVFAHRCGRREARNRDGVSRLASIDFMILSAFSWNEILGTSHNSAHPLRIPLLRDIFDDLDLSKARDLGHFNNPGRATRTGPRSSFTHGAVLHPGGRAAEFATAAAGAVLVVPLALDQGDPASPRDPAIADSVMALCFTLEVEQQNLRLLQQGLHWSCHSHWTKEIQLHHATLRSLILSWRCASPWRSSSRICDCCSRGCTGRATRTGPRRSSFTRRPCDR